MGWGTDANGDPVWIDDTPADPRNDPAVFGNDAPQPAPDASAPAAPGGGGLPRIGTLVGGYANYQPVPNTPYVRNPQNGLVYDPATGAVVPEPQVQAEARANHAADVAASRAPTTVHVSNLANPPAGSPTADLVNAQTGTYWRWNPERQHYEETGIKAATPAAARDRVENGQTGTYWERDPNSGQWADTGIKTGTSQASADALARANITEQGANTRNTASIAGSAANTAATEAGANQRNAATIAEQQGQSLAGFANDDLNRALSAANYAATNGLGIANFGLNQQQAQLQASNDLAKNISNVDPNAYRAFLMGGGGVIANALAGHHNALSDLANLPAARNLETLAQPIAAPDPFSYSPPLTDWRSYFAAPPATHAASAVAPTPQVAPPPTTGQSWLGNGQTAQGGTFAEAPVGFGAQAQTGGYDPVLAAMIRTQSPQGSLGAIPQMAHGGYTHAPVIIAGDPRHGSLRHSNAEPILNPTGAPLGVVNHQQALQMGMLSGNAMGGPPQLYGGTFPRFDTGTDPFGTGVSSADLPYLNQVHDLRQHAQVPDLAGFGLPGNQFNVGYRNALPSLTAGYQDAMQTATGVPAGDIAAEAQRYEVPAINRHHRFILQNTSY